MSKLVSKEGYARNLMVDYIEFDKEMYALYIPYGTEEKIIKKVNNFRKNEPDFTIKELKELRRSMNRELKECLYRIDGYKHRH